MPNPDRTLVAFRDLGLIDYKKGWEYQDALFNGVVEAKLRNREIKTHIPNYLVFCEHPHVYTLGKSGSAEHLLLNEEELKQKDAVFYKINRGGDITYHGPGQVVGYPILDLEQFFTDIHKYLRFLEEMVIRTLHDFNITASRYEGLTGVWIEPENPAKARKICAMGVRTSRWVTMHGFAFNINSDLSYFNNIIPCGINDKKVTSLNNELGEKNVDIEVVKERLKNHFCDLFECELTSF